MSDDDFWEPAMPGYEWNEAKQCYEADPDNILVKLTKEQHARLRELYRNKEQQKRIDNAFHASYRLLDKEAKAKINYELISQLHETNRRKAFDAYIEFVSSWHGLCEVYDGR